MAALGLLGSLLVAYAGPGAIGDRAVTWWYRPGFPSGAGASALLVYLGMAVLGAAWLGLGRTTASRGELLLIGAAWIAPLALGPALYSRDVYSYLAQGTLMHSGLNPYRVTPSALGHGHVLAAVSRFWRHTSAPYGPLFLVLIDLVVVLAGSHLIAGVLLIRLMELGGIALLAVYVPRMTRALGSDERRATWLILSPLAMLELVSAGHNDALMIGLLAAGVTIALEGRPLRGVALCALAATIKLPALAGVAFIAVAWARAEGDRRARLRFLAASALAAGSVLALVSLVTGLGLSWLTSGVVSTPAKVHLAITPATAIGWTVAALGRDIGLGIGTHGAEAACSAAAALLTGGLGLLLLHRVRIATVVPYLGAFLIAAAAGGPAAWPWYFTWGVVLLAACRGAQRAPALALSLALAPFLVKPDGILALPIAASPVVIAVYALLAAGLGARWASARTRSGHPGPRPAAVTRI